MRSLVARLRSFQRELGRRRVYRAGVVYTAAAVALLQAADVIIDGLFLPSWVLTFLIIVALLGLPVALGLAWAFQLTPPGLRREEPAPEGSSDAQPPTVLVVPVRARTVVSGAMLVLFGAIGFAAYVSLGAAPAGEAPSVAVLPFADLGGDPDDEYLRDGLTEDVLTQLAKASELRVISRTSVMQYKDSSKGIRAIGAELGVTHVLEGSVRRTGDRLRISAQLIDARTDQHVWAETYDRTTSDVFEVQADIAHRIARALRVRLTPDERERIAAVPTEDPAAYDLYLRARQYTYRFDRESNEVAIDLARRAVERDPELAPAHALLGTAFALKVRLGEGPEWGDSAMVAAQRAITIDPQLAEGRLALGNAFLRLGRYPDALKSYQRAAALNPSDWRASVNSAVVYSYQGRPVEALRWTRRALDLDPRSPLMGVAYQNVAAYYLDLRLPDQAAAAVARATETQPHNHPQIRTLGISIALQREDHARARALADSLAVEAPTDPSAHLIAGDAYLFSGELARARLHYTRAYGLSASAEGIRHYAPALLGYVLWRQGERERAERLFAEVEALAQEEIARGHDNYTLFFSMAGIAATRGEQDSALRYLERSIESGGVSMEWAVAHDPLLAGIRTHPRYTALLTALTARADPMRREVLEG